MTIEHLKQAIIDRPSYFKESYRTISNRFNVSMDTVFKVFADYDVQKAKRDYNNKTKPKFVETFKPKKEEFNVISNLYSNVPKALKPYKGNPDNVLFIGDLHAPYTLKDYLQFNRELQEKYDCGKVIFAGDLVDGHSWSFHDPNVDGMGVREELNAALRGLQPWFETFPVATSLYGNHDLLVARKAMAMGLSQMFIRDFGEIIKAPKGWNFEYELLRDNVMYIHGSIGNAIKRAKESRISTVQGHLHTESFVQWSVSEKDAIFGMQCGCGIDRKAYAFEYAKPLAKKPVISSSVILENGRLPILELMSL